MGRSSMALLGGNALHSQVDGFGCLAHLHARVPEHFAHHVEAQAVGLDQVAGAQPLSVGINQAADGHSLDHLGLGRTLALGPDARGFGHAAQLDGVFQQDVLDVPGRRGVQAAQGRNALALLVGLHDAILEGPR